MKRIVHQRAHASLAVVLAVALVVTGCSAAAVQAYINLAVNIALQVAALAGLPKASADRVSADLNTVNQLIADYNKADAAAKPGKLAELDKVLNLAQSDLHAILDAVRVEDPKKRAAIEASIAIAITAVESIRALATKSASAKTVSAMREVAPLPRIILPGQKPQSAADLKAQYNQAMRDYSQAQIR